MLLAGPRDGGLPHCGAERVKEGNTGKHQSLLGGRGEEGTGGKSLYYGFHGKEPGGRVNRFRIS